MKKTIAALLMLSLLLTAAACSAGGDGSPETTPAQSAETESAAETTTELTDNLPEKNYAGKKFNALIRSLTNYEMAAEEMNGEIMNDAVFERNRRIDERFGVSLNVIQLGGWASETSEMLSSLKKTILAGDSTYDLALGYQAFVVNMAMDGLYYNLYDVPHMDLTMPWWSQKCVEILTLNNCIYMLTGDISHTMWRGMYVLFFNKQLAADYKLPDIYGVVKSGDWLFDDFYSMVKSVSRDADGDGAYTDADLCGYHTCLANHVRQFMVSLQTPITTPGDDGYPTLTLNQPKSIDVLEKVNALYWDVSTFHSSELQEPSATEVSKVFTGNRALFMSAFLGNAELLRDMDTDFGIIPYPKYDAAQEEYYTATHNSVSTVVIPVTVGDVEMSGLITEALCFDGYKNIVPKYYDVVLKTKYARDEASEEMLDIIREGLSFNFGWVHSVPMDSIGAFYSDLVSKNSTDFASYYSSKEAVYKAGLEKIIAKYKSNES